ncbi:MAG: hypothetical protein FGM15_00045 [Chthoniobacterales bacterium]|nr:hypothetical protein [Chthoniobacterales bacterium]
MRPVETPPDILDAAENVLQIMQRHRIDAVVIGAVALAAHRYVRQTEDLDMAVNADLEHLRLLAATLNTEGYRASLHEPDAQDALGGVIDVEGPFGVLQIISYAGKFPAVIEDALREAKMSVRAGSPLKLVPLPHLVALKLYAGGMKSKADVVEVLLRNPDADLDAMRRLCASYRLAGLEELIDEAKSQAS